MKKTSWITVLLISLIAIVTAAIICLAASAAGLLFIRNQITTYVSDTPGLPLVDSPTSPTLTSEEGIKPGLASPSESTSASQLAAQEMVGILEDTIVPSSDLIAITERFFGLTNIPRSRPEVTAPLVSGEQQFFWLYNETSNTNFQVKATLQYVGKHAYYWVQEDVPFKPRELKKLADIFDQKIYPANRAFFGSEWTPGVDGDPRIHILYARNIGASIAGYYSSADEVPTQANEYSNQREIFIFNADNVDLTGDFTYGVLAHEFQHMIHWNQDRNEESWLNEGFADLAAYLNDFDIGKVEYAYVANTDIQLTDWPADPDPAHYGAAFLFVTYFLDRFGDLATQALVENPANGIAGINEVLEQINALDPLTKQTITADDVVIDWAVALLLRNEKVADGRYTYQNYPASPKPVYTETIRRCPTGMEARQVHQYGIDYIRFRCSGDYTLRFEAPGLQRLLPAEPYSGSYAFWSNQGEESNMQLTNTFDFTDVSGPLTLNYHAWYDLEEGYDFVYLSASTDEGRTWQILTTPSGTAEDPTGNSFGWGYTGASGGWIEEQVDLSQFAGQEVQLRFDYITDAAVYGSGFLLDDLSIPEIGYSTDFEDGDAGWQSQGFVRLQNLLPQTFRLALIEKGGNISIQNFELDGNNVLEIPLHIGKQVDEAILVVIGTTPFTRQPANYTFQIIK